MSQLYCNVADMADLADSVYDAIPAALGSVCPALPAVPKISKNLVAYIAGMLVTAPYAIGAGDTSAAGLAEAHADAVLKYLNLVSDTDFTAFLKRKLEEWYAAAPITTVVLLPKRRPTKRPPGRGCGTGDLDALYGLLNNFNPISRPEKTDRRTRRLGATAALDLNRGASEPDRGRF